MSYTELHTGNLEVLGEDFGREHLKVLLVSNPNLKTDYDIESDDFIILTDYEENYRFVYNKGFLYKFIKHQEHEDCNFINKTIRKGEEVEFTYLFYNGGTYYEELLEEGLDRIQEDDKK